MLALSDYSYAYPTGAFRLRIDTLSLARGEVVFLNGRSGCGKTTVLNLLSGVIPSDIVGRSRTEFGLIGYVMHESTLLPWLSVEQNLITEARLRRVDYDVRKFIAIAERLELDAGCVSLRPRELSHGMRQRIEIAKALSFHVGLLLLDEGLSGIDTATRRQAIRELWRVVCDAGLTIVATAHHPIDVISFAQRVYRVSNGVIGTEVKFRDTVDERLEMPLDKLYRLEEAAGLLSE